GLGHLPFTEVIRVRIPYALQSLSQSDRLFSFKAASQARLCKLARMRKATSKRSLLVKGFG
ncbi:MAG: hypothetical protein EBU05_08640, partial [Chitinophagia bacterium]|nr:hypothetical protein [Chitinophagia bacterium]